jgi:hypothetical protein
MDKTYNDTGVLHGWSGKCCPDTGVFEPQHRLLGRFILCNALIFVLQKHSDSFTETQPMTASFDFFLSGLREFLHSNTFTFR